MERTILATTKTRAMNDNNSVECVGIILVDINSE